MYEDKDKDKIITSADYYYENERCPFDDKWLTFF